MLWDPFLIKKLLKSVICGTVNSTHMHCSQLTKSTIAGWKKKRKKKRGKRGEENVNVQTKRSLYGQIRTCSIKLELTYFVTKAT